MSEGGDRESGKVGAFLLGFLVGVLVCLGVGGTLFLVRARDMHVREMIALDEVLAARDAAALAEQAAREQREQAEKALREAKE